RGDLGVTRAAFTLIELLVTVALAGILMGLLLPVLGSAKKAARDMTCLSQLKEMHGGWTAVMVSGDRRFPNT
ncbi:unnamed protein product, partial [Ectocarpus fasciculatus]